MAIVTSLIFKGNTLKIKTKNKRIRKKATAQIGRIQELEEMQYAKKAGYHMEAKYTMEIGGEMGD